MRNTIENPKSERDDWLRKVSYWSERLDNIRKNKSYLKKFIHITDI